VRGEIAEFVNRDGLRDYPGTEVRFLPDEVIFPPGTLLRVISCAARTTSGCGAKSAFL